MRWDGRPCSVTAISGRRATNRPIWRDEKFAPKFGEFRYKVRKQYTEWLTLVKDKSFRAGAPLRAELMDMVNDDHDSLGQIAEAEALGFNAARLH